MKTRILESLMVMSLMACNVNVSGPAAKDAETIPAPESDSPVVVVPDPTEPEEPAAPLSCNDGVDCPRDLYVAADIFKYSADFTGNINVNRASQSTFFSQSEVKVRVNGVDTYDMTRIHDVYFDDQNDELFLMTAMGTKLMPVRAPGYAINLFEAGRFIVTNQAVNSWWVGVRNARWLDHNTAAIDVCILASLNCVTIERNVE